MSYLDIPEKTKKLFWSVDVNKLEIHEHKKYIIHQVLQYGDLDDWQWLQTVYQKQDILSVFIHQPRSTYQPRSFHFVTKYLLQISDNLNQEKYVRSAL